VAPVVRQGARILLRKQFFEHSLIRLMSLFFLHGPAALSEFRRMALLERCRAMCPAISGLQARFFYTAAHTAASQTEVDALGERLARVLDIDGDVVDPLVEDVAIELRVGPRPGTISPWSSKATDILHNCGLDAINRVERGIAYGFTGSTDLTVAGLENIQPLLHDRMTEAFISDPDLLFAAVSPRALSRVALMSRGRSALEEANREMGLAMSEAEVTYFYEAFVSLQRDPTDVELVMFANVNSEHCRHKIFNAGWTIDDDRLDLSLFDMIRNTHRLHPEHTVVAYNDNSAVIEGFDTEVLRPGSADGHTYSFTALRSHIVCKVETHNHPTAISPYPGASTGVGGEIRDEGATGIGAASQAGLCAFFTSHLHIDGFQQPWEQEYAEFPTRLATPLQIMTEGPIGGAAFGNEFGRPNILGLFRTFEQVTSAGSHRGYHKPIMVAGGIGLIDEEHVEKKTPAAGDCVIQIGGPAMLIGLGGGYASSMDTGSNVEDLDFASVQRENPEMERRCQELISRCVGLGAANPIITIHDVGAGGLSNACPELISESGASFELRAIHNDDPGMSPMELWCNEAQERYVLVVGRADLERFQALAERERCPVAVIGGVGEDATLSLLDSSFEETPIEALPLDIILGKPPRMERDVRRQTQILDALDLSGVHADTAALRVLRFPAVAAKTFLITIADRTVTGLIARDQMVGPHQTPLADVAVTANSFKSFTGSAMAMGERTPAAIIDGPASGRLAVAEAVTNIAAAEIGEIERIKLSANWMCGCGEEGEDARLYDTVKALGMEFCPAAGLSIPVGKDSLSMRTLWEDGHGESHKVVAPLSLVVSAFAPVRDIRRTVTPDLKPVADSQLLLVDLGRGRNRLGASCLAQVYEQLGDECADVDPTDLRSLFAAVQEMVAAELLLAYHDRSDGGLFATLAEMAFGCRCGLDLNLSELGEEPLNILFAEEVGVVIQYRQGDEGRILGILAKAGLAACSFELGTPVDDDRIRLSHGDDLVIDESASALRAAWNELTYQMQAQRDNPDCARQEFESISDTADPGLNPHVSFDVDQLATSVISTRRPTVAILREQGINGQVEMAAAFDAAGCEAVDVTMTDLIAGRTDLSRFQGLAVCGGFSYGDVLGAGAGWARSILFDARLRDQFAAFFERPDSFSLGVCNGCQMLSLLGELIPGSEGWPRFLRNTSEQFEARLVTVEILESSSVLLTGMSGSRLPIAVAHGEGRVEFGNSADMALLGGRSQLGAVYVDNDGSVTERYPLNPNGSPGGITALSSRDGRVTLMMPHPERVFRTVQLSWRPDNWDASGFSPWIQLFRNATTFCGQA
jgi:phosphoribosylformylglycinamidine synthase